MNITNVTAQFKFGSPRMVTFHRVPGRGEILRFRITTATPKDESAQTTPDHLLIALFGEDRRLGNG